MKEVGIACYIDNTTDMLTEFGWLVKSWLYSGSWFTSDIVAFHHPNILPPALPRERGVTYVPLSPFVEKHPEWSDYPFINSIGFMSEPEAGILANYKYILKTDCDCFLTPYFPTLRPRLTTFGAGQYTRVPSVTVRLAQVAEKWKIEPIFTNIGSTVMGFSNRVLMYSQIHLEYCRKLRTEEFTEEELKREGLGEWPGWYKGVLSMYAGQLAAQAYFGMAMNIGGLDCHCMSHDPISPSDYHIHAWHSYEHFSKLNWRKGKYRGYDMDNLDITRIADYCLWIAGEGLCE